MLELVDKSEESEISFLKSIIDLFKLRVAVVESVVGAEILTVSPADVPTVRCGPVLPLGKIEKASASKEVRIPSPSTLTLLNLRFVIGARIPEPSPPPKNDQVPSSVNSFPKVTVSVPQR